MVGWLTKWIIQNKRNAEPNDTEIWMKCVGFYDDWALGIPVRNDSLGNSFYKYIQTWQNS